MARMCALRVRRKPHTVFGTIKHNLCQTRQSLCLFLLLRRSRSDERFNEVELKRTIAEPDVAE